MKASEESQEETDNGNDASGGSEENESRANRLRAVNLIGVTKEMRAATQTVEVRSRLAQQRSIQEYWD